MLVIFVSKMLCSVMNLTIYWAFGHSDSIYQVHISLVDEYAFKAWAPLYII